MQLSDRNVRWVAAVTGIALIVFIATALAVSNGMTAAIDRSLMLELREPANRSDPIGPSWFEEAAAEFTTLGGYTVIATFAIVAALGLVIVGQWRATVFLGASLISGVGVSTLAKQLFERSRPNLVDHLDTVTTWSFPSAHALFGMLAWLTMATVLARFVRNNKFRAYIVSVAATIGLLIGLSRIYLGVHWPSDVLAGWALGIAWAGTCWLTARGLGRRLRRYASP